MWYPYRYLIAGRTQWEVMWVDPKDHARPARFSRKGAGAQGRPARRL